MGFYNPMFLLCFMITFDAPSAAHAQGSAGDYPSKPVRVVVGLAAGGGTDIQARLIAQKLSESTGRSFVVENRTGAGGTVAYASVAKSPPDGYTLLAVAVGYSITPAVYEKLAYDPIKDFAPISLVIDTPLMMVVHPSLPVKSVKELVALAKSRPGVLNAASAGIGTSNHLALELFKYLARVNIVHIPYKGAGPALIDVIGGQADMQFPNILSALPLLKSAKLRALGVTTIRRSPLLPELPTIAEAGVPEYEISTWFGMLAPAGTPAAIVNRISAEVARIVKTPEMISKLTSDGGDPVGSTPEQFTRHLVTEIARWRRVVKETGLKID